MSRTRSSRTREDAARALVAAVKADLKPRDIVTKKAIENAVAVIMATGGSTNAVLHFLAIAHAAEVPNGPSTTSSVCASKHPGDLRPEAQRQVPGHRPAPCAGGIPAGDEGVARTPALLHGDCITITGKTVAQNLAAVFGDQPDAAAHRPGRDPHGADKARCTPKGTSRS